MLDGSGDSVSLNNEAQVVTVLRESVQGLWEVVNNLTRLRPTRRPEFRVTIFGSARIPSDHWVYAAVRDLAAELARMGCAIVTGGGPGLMQAANEGAALGKPVGWDAAAVLRLTKRMAAMSAEYRCDTYVGAISSAMATISPMLREGTAWVSRWPLPEPPPPAPEPVVEPHRHDLLVRCHDCGELVRLPLPESA